MENPERDYSPFNQRLSDEAINEDDDYAKLTEVREFENNPDKVVRVNAIAPPYTYEDSDLVDLKELRQMTVQNAKDAKFLFGKLDNYLTLPHYNFVVSENPEARDYPTLYTVTDRVYGEPLDDAMDRTDSPVSNEQLDQLFHSVIAYYKSVPESGGSYLTDIPKLSQFMYGHTGEDPTDKIYFVDLDLMHATYGKSESEVNAFVSRLHKIRAMITEATRLRGDIFTAAITELDDLREQV